MTGMPEPRRPVYVSRMEGMKVCLDEVCAGGSMFPLKFTIKKDGNFKQNHFCKRGMEKILFLIFDPLQLLTQEQWKSA